MVSRISTAAIKKVPTHEFVYFRCMRESGTKPQLSLEKLPEKIRQNQFGIQDVDKRLVQKNSLQGDDDQFDLDISESGGNQPEGGDEVDFFDLPPALDIKVQFSLRFFCLEFLWEYK